MNTRKYSPSNTTSTPTTLQRLSLSYFISVKNLFHKLNLFNVISHRHRHCHCHHHQHHVCCNMTRTRGSWVPSPSIGDWHRRVGFVVEELKLMTISYIALTMNFNILEVVDEYYNDINSKMVCAGENRCFPKWPLYRDVGWVLVIKRVPWASRCQNWHTVRSAPCHRISYSLSPALAFYKKHKGYDIVSVHKHAWMHIPAIWRMHLVASRPQEPLDATPLPSTEIGQQGDLLANLRDLLFISCLVL